MTDLTAGVVGTGTMGGHHARVYAEHRDIEFVGVHDADHDRARSVAGEDDAVARSLEDLLDRADILSIAVPTEYHYDIASRAIDAGVHVLVEKPLVDRQTRGEDLVSQAERNDVILQVGHIERFNPATQVLADIVPDLDVVAVDIDRLGPPLDRENEDNVVMDLMIHDLDILLSLVDEDVTKLSAVARDDCYVTSQFKFGDDSVATVTASRLTQEKVRTLSITAVSCRVNVDFIGQSVEIHRRSLPEYVESDGDIRYRHESVVERPMIETGEPLKAELASFVAAVETGTEPVVTPADALEVLEMLGRIESDALGTPRKVTPP
jgi:predicted dehydrogenase